VVQNVVRSSMIKYVFSFLFLILIGCDGENCSNYNNNSLIFVPECGCGDVYECELGYECEEDECVLIED